MPSPRSGRVLAFLAFLVFALIALAPLPAFGVAQRTFVSGGGSDANPCSIVSPCRSFGAAVAQTAVGGEVVVQDSAGYGPVTLTQSVSIISPEGVYAGISVPVGQSGVTINNASAVVVLRGLTINGQGGDEGIFIQQAARVHVESCVVSRMGDDGLVLLPGAGAAEVFVNDTIFRDNANYAVYAFPFGIKLTLDHVRAERSGFNGLGIAGSGEITIRNSVVANNQGFGIVVNVSAGTTDISITDSEFVANTGSGLNTNPISGAIVHLSVARSTFRGNGARGIYAEAILPSTVVMSVQDSILSDNALSGMYANDTGVFATAARNTVTGNSYGFVQTGSVFESLRDNIVRNNAPGGDTMGVITTLSGI